MCQYKQHKWGEKWCYFLCCGIIPNKIFIFVNELIYIYMNLVYFVFLTFLISAAVGWVAIPRIVIIAKMKRLFDAPNNRKVHKEAVPRLGGISFFPGSMFAFATMLGLRYYFGFELGLAREGYLIVEFLFMISGMFLLFFIGLADDLVGVGFKNKFIAQLFAATMLIFAGLSIDNFEGLLWIEHLPMWLSSIVTVVVVVFVINAFNLIDGVDGLCSGTGTIVLSAFGAWFIYIGEYVYAMFAFSMVGVVMAFFQYNVLGHRLKIFMGDTGSLTLGYMVIFLGLKFLSIDTQTYPDIITLHSPLAILFGLIFLPAFDTLRVFISRIARGKSPFHPDKTHIHHKLLALGFNHIHNTLTLLSGQLCILALNVVLSELCLFNVNIVILVDIVIGVSVNVMLNRMIVKRGVQNKIKTADNVK